jgi:hypothetical protein
MTGKRGDAGTKGCQQGYTLHERAHCAHGRPTEGGTEVCEATGVWRDARIEEHTNSEGWDLREVASEGHDRQKTRACRSRLPQQESERAAGDVGGVSGVSEQNIKALFDPPVWPDDPDGDGA